MIRRAARDSDLASVRELLSACGLPLAGVDEAIEHFFVAPEGETLAGVVGLEIFSVAALLRSLAVFPSHRRAGIGERLVRRAVDFASLLGVGDLYLLTPDAEGYFARFGFRTVSRQELPEELRGSPELGEICASATAMRLRIPAEAGPPVRRARPADLPALVRLMDELTITQSPTATRAAARPERYTAALRAIDAHPRQELLVADVDGAVAGTLTVIVVPNLSHGGSPWAIVENVIVDAAFRGRGVARALFAAAIRRARAAGCYKVGLTSNFARGEAHAVYEALGFRRYAHGYRLEL